MTDKSKKNCKACAHSFMEPSDMNLTCGHTDAGVFGLTIRSEPLPHCPEFSKFEQHPLRFTEQGGNMNTAELKHLRKVVAAWGVELKKAQALFGFRISPTGRIVNAKNPPLQNIRPVVTGRISSKRSNLGNAPKSKRP